MEKVDNGNPEAPATGFEGQATNQSGMRQRNERLVLTLLRRTAGLAKADIARQTGLSAQTVSRMIRALEADDLIRRGAPQRGRVGQPSVPLSLNPRGAYFFGLKVGRRSAELILTDFLGAIVERDRTIYDYPDVDGVLHFAVDRAATLRARLPAERRDRVAGMGIAMPFHLWDWAPLIGVSPAKMANWKSRDLRSELAEATGLPLFLQNDATAACSAELVFGAGGHPANFLTFFIAFFIGGGLALRGSLYTGAAGNAAGFGPLMVPAPDGATRPLIELASLSALERRLLARGHDPRHIWEQPNDWNVSEDLLDDWLDSASGGLGHAIRSAQTILDLDAVLIDGWMPRPVLAALRDRIERRLDGHDLSGINRPQLVTGTVGPDARSLGAASLPLSARFLIE